MFIQNIIFNNLDQVLFLDDQLCIRLIFVANCIINSQYRFFFNFLFKLSQKRRNEMGNCANIKNNGSLKKSYQICPDDISTFNKNSLDKKQFEGHLTNVKIQSLSDNLVNQSFGIKFVIPEILSIDFPVMKANDRKIKWQKDKSFNFAINQYEMRSNFLRIIIRSEDGKKQTELKINLYRILTGPYHHDFSIGSKSKVGGRLIFDLRVSQLVSLKLDVLKVNANLTKQYPGDKFNFVLQSNSNQSFDRQKHKQKPIVKSQASYPYIVPLEKNQKYRLISQLDQAPSPTFRLKRKASNLIKIETSSTLSWSKQQQNQMPFLKLKVKSSQLFSSIFYLKIYKFIDNRRFAQFCQFSFTFSQIISSSPNEKINTLQQRSVNIDKSLTYNGKNVGTCNLNVSVKFTKFINQTPNCTQTQDGVVNMSHIQLYKIEALSQQKQYIALEKSLNKILKLKQQLQVGDDIAQISKLNHSIAHELQKMNQQFAKHWRNSFAYQNQKSKKLQDRKILLIRILKLLASLIDENNDTSLSEICWKNVVWVVRRGEMHLKYWQFSQQQNKSIFQGNFTPQMKQKVQINLDCMKTLYHLLELALNTEIQCTFNQEKQQCQVFKAYCFFRIPLFRKKFLITVEQNLKKSQQTLQKFDIHQNEYIADSLQLIPHQVDWENKFFKALLCTERGVQIEKQLSNIIQEHQWFNVIVNYNEIYCNFLRYLIAKFFVLKDVIKLPRWNYFIGYSLLVKALLRIMCTTQLGLYQNYLIFTAMSLLQNQKLSAPMIKILFKKTNLHDQSLVLKLIYILSHFFHVLTKNNKNLINFPYTYLMKGIKQILESDCSIGLSHSVIFFYNYYQRFDSYFRYELSLYLLGKLFWKMFFNWSFNMRRIYYHMIILRIAQDTELLETTDIKQRLDLCCRIVANGQYYYEKRRRKQKIDTQFQKLLHKQMKDKFKNKIKNKQGINKLNHPQNIFKNKFTFEELTKIDEKVQEIQIPNYGQRTIMPINDENSNTLINKSQNKLNYDNEYSLKSIKLKKKRSYLEYKFIYHCFTQTDFQISEIDFPVDQYMECSAKEFKEILKLVQEHFEKTSCLPYIDLGFKIQIDQKEILPAQFDQINFQ